MVKNNVLMNRINKRVIQQMLKQSALAIPNEQPLQEDQDVKTNYNLLMKTLNLIFLYLSDATLTIKRDFPNLREFGPDIDDDSANPFSRDGFIPSVIGRDVGRDDESTASSASSASPPFYRQARINYRMPNYGRVIPPNPYRDDLSELSDESSFPDLSQFDDPSQESYYRNDVRVGINGSAVEREAVNLKFYVDELTGQFNLLTKPQKERLRKIIIKITNQINLINQKYPNSPLTSASFQLIKSNFSIINDELTKSGERTIKDSGEYEFDESIGAGRINRKLFNMHQPTKYVNARSFNPQNVNANFLYNLAKQNN